MIFLTLGTYPLQFDRLLKAVDNLCRKGIIKDEVFAQTGFSTYTPQHMPYEKLLEKGEFDRIFKSSDSLIGHAGMGTISQALDCGKPFIAVPRRKQFGEHVNDHQLDTARKFESLNHLLVAYKMDELPEKIEAVKCFVPEPRINQAEQIATEIGNFLKSLVK